jgi:hypothetical protein
MHTMPVGVGPRPSHIAFEQDRTVAEPTPAIDLEKLPTSTQGFLVSHFITVRSVAWNRSFYSGVLGGQVVLEENPCIVNTRQLLGPVTRGRARRAPSS